MAKIIWAQHTCMSSIATQRQCSPYQYWAEQLMQPLCLQKFKGTFAKAELTEGELQVTYLSVLPAHRTL